MNLLEVIKKYFPDYRQDPDGYWRHKDDDGVMPKIWFKYWGFPIYRVKNQDEWEQYRKRKRGEKQ